MAPRLPAASPRSLLLTPTPTTPPQKKRRGPSPSVSVNDFGGAVRGMAGRGWVCWVGAGLGWRLTFCLNSLFCSVFQTKFHFDRCQIWNHTQLSAHPAPQCRYFEKNVLDRPLPHSEAASAS